MTIQLVIFSYAPDKELLNLNLTHLARLRAERPDLVLRVHVADDASEPASDENAALTAGASYERTSFDRGERINGLPCLDGMLGVYRRLSSKENPPNWICQLDCDTLVQHFEWLERCPKGAVLTGCRFREKALDFAYGPTIAMRPAALDAIEKGLSLPGVRDRLVACECFTDRVTTYLAQLGGGKTFLWDASRQTGKRVNGFFFATAPETNRELALLYSHLVFEKRLLPRELTAAEKRARCAALMKDYLAMSPAP